MGTILKNGISYSGSGGGGGVSSYNELTNKPSINNVTLTGNKTTADLAISYNDLTDKPIIPTGGDYYETGDAAETALADGDYFPFQDVSANGRRKTLWSNIKSVLKTYFDTLYNAKLTAGTNITISSNTISASVPTLGVINRSDLYDTTEKVVGMWTDGRPIYQKVVSFTMNSSSTSLAEYTVSHGISNLRELVESRVVWNYNASSGASDSERGMTPWFVGDSYTSTNNIYYCNIKQTTVNIQFRNASIGWNSVTFYIILKYTKTTDAANSFNYANENDYSTGEKIVGTWIDGSTLYQRTFTGTTGTGDSTTVASFSKYYHVRSWNGGFTQDSTNNIDVPIVYCFGTDATHDYMTPVTENGSLKLYYGSNNAKKSYWITVQYTK